MYKKVKIEGDFITKKGATLSALEDECGGKARIINDDSCLVLQLFHGPQGWQNTTHIFPEALEAMQEFNPIKANVTTVQINFNKEETTILDKKVEDESLGKRTVYCKQKVLKSFKD